MEEFLKNQDAGCHGEHSALLPRDLPAAGKKPSSLRRNWYPLTVFIVAFILFFDLYLYTQRETSGLNYWFDDWIFYADSSSSYSHMKQISFEGNMWRHPLYPLIVHPLVAGIRAIFGFGMRQAAEVVIALFAASNVSLASFLFHFCIKERMTVLLFTGLYGILFSNLVFFSIPETYSLANMGILVFFLFLVRFYKNFSGSRAIILGAVSGLGALVNPPLGLLLFPGYALFFRQLAFRQSLRYSLWATLAALLVYSGTNLLFFGFDYLEYTRKLVNRWATFSNYLHPANWLNVAISFFLYGVISPLEELERSIGLKDIHGYFRSYVKIIPFSIFVVYLGYTLIHTVRRATDQLILASAGWLAVILIFYVYFNPREAFLYSCQTLAPFMLIMARSFDDIPWKLKTVPLGLFLLTLAYVNIKCLQG